MANIRLRSAQAKLKVTAAELRAYVDTAEQKSSDVTAFLKLVQKYEHIETLTPEIMHELIEKIVVHTPDKSIGKRTQQIDIYFRFDVAASSVEVGKQDTMEKRLHNAVLCGLY